MGSKAELWIEGIFAGIISVGWPMMDRDKDTKGTVSGLLVEGVSFNRKVGLEFQRVSHLSWVIWRRVRLTVSFQEAVVRY